MRDDENYLLDVNNISYIEAVERKTFVYTEDAIYESKIVTKLINAVMLDGKKGTAQSIVYEAFETVKNKTGKEALEVFNEAIEKLELPVRENIEFCQKKIKNREIEIQKYNDRKNSRKLGTLFAYIIGNTTASSQISTIKFKNNYSFV